MAPLLAGGLTLNGVHAADRGYEMRRRASVTLDMASGTMSGKKHTKLAQDVSRSTWCNVDPIHSIPPQASFARRGSIVEKRFILCQGVFHEGEHVAIARLVINARAFGNQNASRAV